MSSVPTDVLAQIGVELELEDGDLVTDAIVLCKVSTADGDTRMISGTSEGTDWITVRGMLAIAESAGQYGDCDCDD